MGYGCWKGGVKAIAAYLAKLKWIDGLKGYSPQ